MGGELMLLWYFVNQQFSECPHRSLLPNLRIPLRALCSGTYSAGYKDFRGFSGSGYNFDSGPDEGSDETNSHHFWTQFDKTDQSAKEKEGRGINAYGLVLVSCGYFLIAH